MKGKVLKTFLFLLVFLLDQTRFSDKRLIKKSCTDSIIIRQILVFILVFFYLKHLSGLKGFYETLRKKKFKDPEGSNSIIGRVPMKSVCVSSDSTDYWDLQFFFFQL